jgi:hypothetical protein
MKRGYRFEMRYLCRLGVRSINTSKIARAEEVQASLAAGLDVGLIWQDTKADAKRGRGGGLDDGHEALRQATALAAGAGMTIYFAVADYDVPDVDLPVIEDYVRAVRDVFAGRYRVGVYGKRSIVERLRAIGAADAVWQSYGYSRPVGEISPHADLYQRREQVNVAGVLCDVNEARMANAGGWQQQEAPMTFVQARWFTETNGRPIDLLVVHSMEMDEKPDTAEVCARYFATTDTKASAHACVDVDSRVDCVIDKDVAYAAPGANHDGLHLELAGRARQTRAEWLDQYSRRMIEGPAAEWVAAKAKFWRIPLEFLKADALRAGRRGVTTHNEVRLAFGKTTHTDPGNGFPMDVLLTRARFLAGSVPAASTKDTDMRIATVPAPGQAPGPYSGGRDPYFVVTEVEGRPAEFVVASVNGAAFDPPWQNGQKVDNYAEDFEFIGLWWRKFFTATGRMQGVLDLESKAVVCCEGGGTYTIATA